MWSHQTTYAAICECWRQFLLEVERERVNLIVLAGGVFLKPMGRESLRMRLSLPIAVAFVHRNG